MNQDEQLAERISAAVYHALLQSLPETLREQGVSLAPPATAEGQTAAAPPHSSQDENNATLQGLLEQLQQARQTIAGLEEEVRATGERLDLANAAADEKSRQLIRLQERADDYAARLRESESQHSQSCDEAEQGRMALTALLERFFPDYLTAIPELQPCLNEWKTELGKGDATSQTVLAICSNLFTWSVFCRAEGAEADAAASTALFNFSRNFFDWLERKGTPAHEAWHIAYAMQEAFNRQMASYGMAYAVELPELGCQFEASAMVKSPRSIQGGQDVASVLAWGLTSTQNNVYKKKSLVLLS